MNPLSDVWHQTTQSTKFGTALAVKKGVLSNQCMNACAMLEMPHILSTQSTIWAPGHPDQQQ